MQSTPKKYILSMHSKQYPKQGLNHCGAFSVKAILSAFERDDNENPRDYHPHIVGRITGGTLGRTYWLSVFRTYGLHATINDTKTFSNKQRLEKLKSILAKDNPIMLRIGNGYLPNGTYVDLVRRLLSHWVTIWGYDDSKQLFYVYDSAVPKKHERTDLPNGNTTRTYEEILRVWQGGIFPLPLRYTYIEVSENPT